MVALIRKRSHRMVKGYERHQERLQALALFAKDLVRRAKSGCELCGASGTSLATFEVPPVAAEPDYDHCIMVCGTCRQQLDNPRSIDPNHWRSLSNVIWSDTAPVQVLAVGLLRILAKEQPWATELMEQLYLREEIEDWIDRLDLLHR